MAERRLVWFVSDVHLGLGTLDPAERERRFVAFLKGIPRDSLALWLLGDVWDFWYEYRDVAPKCGARVLAELINLSDAGVQVHFVPGNHDMWTKGWFEELGISIDVQPVIVSYGGKTFCLGHGDRLGGGRPGYNLLQRVFHSKVARSLFSTLHPWMAYRLGNGWSAGSREGHSGYEFRTDESEPLYRFAMQQKADFCIFGHFHRAVDTVLPSGARLIILKDWIDGGAPHAVFDAGTGELLLQ